MALGLPRRERRGRAPRLGDHRGGHRLPEVGGPGPRRRHRLPDGREAPHRAAPDAGDARRPRAADRGAARQAARRLRSRTTASSAPSTSPPARRRRPRRRATSRSTASSRAGGPRRSASTCSGRRPSTAGSPSTSTPTSRPSPRRTAACASRPPTRRWLYGFLKVGDPVKVIVDVMRRVLLLAPRRCPPSSRGPAAACAAGDAHAGTAHGRPEHAERGLPGRRRGRGRASSTRAASRSTSPHALARAPGAADGGVPPERVPDAPRARRQAVGRGPRGDHDHRRRARATSTSASPTCASTRGCMRLAVPAQRAALASRTCGTLRLCAADGDDGRGRHRKARAARPRADARSATCSSMLLHLGLGRCDAVVYDLPALATLKARAPQRYGDVVGLIRTERALRRGAAEGQRARRTRERGAHARCARTGRSRGCRSRGSS